MKKFMVIYHAPMDAMEQMGNVSPEEQAEGMKAWNAWADQCGDRMVDLGTPLAGGIKLIVDDLQTKVPEKLQVILFFRQKAERN